jgi:hypothetical protein
VRNPVGDYAITAEKGTGRVCAWIRPLIRPAPLSETQTEESYSIFFSESRASFHVLTVKDKRADEETHWQRRD